MHIVVAPDSFKGTASAPEAAASIAMGVRQALPDATVTTLPMADGGEGTVQAMVEATQGRRVDVIYERVDEDTLAMDIKPAK